MIALALTAAASGAEYSLDSKAYGRTRKVIVHTPPGYSAQRAEPYGVLICFDGLSYYRNEIPVPQILDELTAGGKIAPMIAILVDTNEGRLEDLANNQRFAKFLGDELIPWARGKWRISTDPRHSVVAGASAGGLAAAYVAFQRPDLFGNVLSQSGAFWRGNESSNSEPWEWLTAQYAGAAKKAIRFYVEVGGLETRQALGRGPVFIEANRRFRDALVKKGNAVTYLEVPEAGHEPAHWRAQFVPGLVRLTADWDK